MASAHGESPSKVVSAGMYGLPMVHSPGRFFAVWEVKMSLMHCVMKYDLKPHERASAKYVWGKQASHMNIKLKMRMRRESNASS